MKIFVFCRSTSLL